MNTLTNTASSLDGFCHGGHESMYKSNVDADVTALNSNEAQRATSWILTIDDDPEFSYVLKLNLQSRGYTVVRAESGTQGYQLAFELDPVAILLDLTLPGERGEEILSQLRFHPATVSIPIAIVTGMATPEVRDRMLLAGVSAFFRKPVGVAALTDFLANFRR